MARKQRRKKREGEYVCYCNAYPFPHRFGGGLCSGLSVVEEHWGAYYGGCEECRGCNLLDNNECQVIQGLAKPSECGVWREFVRYNEIKITGR